MSINEICKNLKEKNIKYSIKTGATLKIDCLYHLRRYTEIIAQYSPKSFEIWRIYKDDKNCSCKK